jgi:Domain of unknown function (DU1801)
MVRYRRAKEKMEEARTRGTLYASPMSEGFDEVIDATDPRVRNLATRTRALIQTVMPNVVEVPWPRQRVIGYGVGPKKMSEHYAYLAVHPRHVNLGCNYGAHLDHGGLLEGTGQNMRKLTVRTVDALADPRLVPLLRAARVERLTALGRA